VTITEPRVEAPEQPPPQVSERTRHERRLGLALSAPAFIVMVFVTAYPLIYAVVLSFYNYRLTDPEGRTFVGLRNFATVLTDPVWWSDFLTTLIITAASVAVELVLGFAFAFVMYRILFGRSLVRTGILVPYGIITVVSAFIWRYAFQLDSGFVNQWLGLGDFNWFGQRWSSLFVITLSEIWKTTPFISLLLLAGLVQVPAELNKAAMVDGATAWQRLTRVTLPNMKAAIMVALLFRTLDAWRIFDNPFIMTAGANNTETLSFLAYRQNVTLLNLGVGSAVSVLLFIKGFGTDLSQVRGDR
jgi:multiple sugar transport system permease protein